MTLIFFALIFLCSDRNKLFLHENLDWREGLNICEHVFERSDVFMCHICTNITTSMQPTFETKSDRQKRWDSSSCFSWFWSSLSSYVSSIHSLITSGRSRISQTGNVLAHAIVKNGYTTHHVGNFPNNNHQISQQKLNFCPQEVLMMWSFYFWKICNIRVILI